MKSLPKINKYIYLYVDYYTIPKLSGFSFNIESIGSNNINPNKKTQIFGNIFNIKGISFINPKRNKLNEYIKICKMSTKIFTFRLK